MWRHSDVAPRAGTSGSNLRGELCRRADLTRIAFGDRFPGRPRALAVQRVTPGAVVSAYQLFAVWRRALRHRNECRRASNNRFQNDVSRSHVPLLKEGLYCGVYTFTPLAVRMEVSSA